MRFTLALITILAGCEELDDTSPDSSESCCAFDCDDGETSGWVAFTEDADECYDYAETQCAAAEAEVASWDYAEGCLSCDDC